MSNTHIPAPTVEHLTDDELMARLTNGDVEESLAEIQSRYGQRILNFVTSIVHDSHLAEDICQNVFAKVFFKSHLYRPQGNFRAWIFEVARNQALSALRARRQIPKPFSGISQDDGGCDPLEAAAPGFEDRGAEEDELVAAFEQAVEGLPDRYKEVFDMCVQKGMQYRQAARLLNVPIGTVAIRIMRARKRLFQELEPHLDRIRRPPACFLN